MQKISHLKKFRAAALLLSVALFSSCASQSTSDVPDSLPISEADELAPSEQATPVADDSSVFADLAAQGSPGMTADFSDAPFYNPIGGESLGRVAYTLYGSRAKWKELAKQNPELASVKTLTAEQKVYFDFSRVRPVVTYLTKDLIDRYPGELASRIEQNNSLPKDSISVSPGETLQAVSQRLYGTTRYWTEIYLLNRGTINHYDKVRAGMTLAVYQRSGIAAPAVTPTQEAPVAQVRPLDSPKVAEPEMPTHAVPADPIPETPNFSQDLATNAADPVPETKPAVREAAPAAGFMDPNSANTRRMIYVGLIVLIGALAFYFTKSSKKKSFDMLDVTTSDTAASGRAKLNEKDSHHQDIG